MFCVSKEERENYLKIRRHCFEYEYELKMCSKKEGRRNLCSLVYQVCCCDEIVIWQQQTNKVTWFAAKGNNSTQKKNIPESFECLLQQNQFYNRFIIHLSQEYLKFNWNVQKNERITKISSLNNNNNKIKRKSFDFFGILNSIHSFRRNEIIISRKQLTNSISITLMLYIFRVEFVVMMNYVYFHLALT